MRVLKVCVSRAQRARARYLRGRAIFFLRPARVTRARAVRARDARARDRPSGQNYFVTYDMNLLTWAEITY